MEIFDEDKAVEFIKSALPADGIPVDKYTSDDILEVIDIIWDYYEDNGFLDLDLAESDSPDADIQVIISHVEKMIKKDKNTKIQVADIPSIVRAELAYEAECDKL